MFAHPPVPKQYSFPACTIQALEKYLRGICHADVKQSHCSFISFSSSLSFFSSLPGGRVSAYPREILGGADRSGESRFRAFGRPRSQLERVTSSATRYNSRFASKSETVLRTSAYDPDFGVSREPGILFQPMSLGRTKPRLSMRSDATRHPQR